MKNLNPLLFCILLSGLFTTLHAQWTDYGAYIGTSAINDVYIDGINGERLYFENNGSTVNELDNRGIGWSLDEGNTAGDDNTGTLLMTNYYDYVNNRLLWDTDWVETAGVLMTLTQSTGRLGIGIDAPAAKLHVAGGDVQIDDSFAFYTANTTGTGNAGLAIDNNGINVGLLFWKRSLDAVVLHRNTLSGTNHDFILNRTNGNIGLNRGLAEYRLDVAGDRIRLLDDGSAPTKSVALATDISSGVDLRADSVNFTISRTTNGGDVIHDIRFDDTELNISSYNNDVNIYARNELSGTDGDIRCIATDDVWLTALEGDILIDADNTNSVDGDVTINADDDVIINNNGIGTLFATETNNVGIGIASPVERLDVIGGIRIGTAMAANAGTIQWDGIEFQGYDGAAWVPLSGGGMSLWSQNGAFAYYNTGNVGIGTMTPAFDLQVAGNVDITGELTAASDARLKKDIRPFNNALAMLTQLNPVSYFYNAEAFPNMNLAERKKIGLLAQDVEAVMPNLVSEGTTATDTRGEEFTVKSVNYMEMIPVLIKAVQELETKLEEKDTEIQELKNIVEQITKKMEK